MRFGHMCLTALEQFACFYFEFSLATWSVSKNQMRFDHMHLIACKAVCLCSLWVLIGYAICLQKPKAIKSHMFNCTWANFLVFNLSSHWLSDLLPKTKWNLVTHIRWHISSLPVFTLSSDWLSDLFLKNQKQFGHTYLIASEQFACFHFEFSLVIRSVAKN